MVKKLMTRLRGELFEATLINSGERELQDSYLQEKDDPLIGTAINVTDKPIYTINTFTLVELITADMLINELANDKLILKTIESREVRSDSDSL